MRFANAGAWPHTVVDLSALYSDHAERVWRGVALGADGRVILQDEWTAPAVLSLEARWQMLTRAEIDLSSDCRTITLRQNGQAFVLRVSSSDDFRVEVVDVSRPVRSFDEPNPGARLLVLHTHTRSGGEGGFRLVGALAGTPATDGPAPPFQPLAEWSAPDPGLAAG